MYPKGQKYADVIVTSERTDCRKSGVGWGRVWSSSVGSGLVRSGNGLYEILRVEFLQNTRAIYFYLLPIAPTDGLVWSAYLLATACRIRSNRIRSNRIWSNRIWSSQERSFAGYVRYGWVEENRPTRATSVDNIRKARILGRL